MNEGRTATIERDATRVDGLARFGLRLDAVASGATGLVVAAASAALDGPLGVPRGWLVGVGAGMVVWAAALLWLAGRPRVAGAVWAVLVLNAVWVVDSAVTVVADGLPLTGVGRAVVAAQALAVLAVMDVQYLGVRRIRAAGRVVTPR